MKFKSLTKLLLPAIVVLATVIISLAGKITFRGQWSTNFGTVKLEQSGDKVTGTYREGDGRLEGTVNGNRLDFQWFQKPTMKPPRDAGDGYFVIADDGKSIEGKWRYGFTGEWEEEPWKGRLWDRPVLEEELPDIKEHHPEGTKGGPMVLVPEGDFKMGCNNKLGHGDCFSDMKPYHDIFLDDYYIDRYEVTNSEYAECVKAGKCKPAHFDDKNCWVTNFTTEMDPPGYGILPDHARSDNQPAVCVDWNQSKSYCEYAGKRLPTEAEWEKAARGTDDRKYPWGDSKAGCRYAIMRDSVEDDEYKFMNGCGKVTTWPVGSKKLGMSPYGALDMTGNVSEWTADWYDEKYYQKSPRKNPKGPSKGKYKSTRGGYFAQRTPYLYVRGSQKPGHNGEVLGFRCAKSR